jgi:hypothetical protein
MTLLCALRHGGAVGSRGESKLDVDFHIIKAGRSKFRSNGAASFLIS